MPVLLRQVVAFGPRPAGSAALAATRGYIKKQLAALLRRAGHGPGNWCSDDDLLHLRRGFGLQ